MHAVIARLRLLNEQVPRPLPRPTLADVSRVEQELHVKLPEDFIAFQLAAGDVVYGTYEPVTLTPETGHTYIVPVATAAWAQGVPHEYLPFCESNGDYFCLTPSGTVVFWSHESAASEAWPSLESWISKVWLEENAL